MKYGKLFLLGLLILTVILTLACPPKPAPIVPAVERPWPKEFRLGLVSFLSGAAAVFGVPGAQAAEICIEKINAEGGIAGRVKIVPILIDETGGPEKCVIEFRRLVLDEKVHAVIGYISSADCLAIQPVAEELKTLTIFYDCGTYRLFEEPFWKWKYSFRTKSHQVIDNVGGVFYLLDLMGPRIKTIAGINQDYAWGRDSWEIFKQAMLALRPDVKVVAELWPKLFAGEYSAEITKLLAIKPDVIHSSFWNGDLEAFIKQAAPRGLFEVSTVFLTPGEHAIQDLGKDYPEGIVVGARGNHYYMYPDPATSPLHKWFVDTFKARFGRYPIYPSYHMAQAVFGLKAAYEKAIELVGGWPTTEEVIKAFEGLAWEAPSGTVVMRRDHNAIESALFGVIKRIPEWPYAMLDKIKVYPPEMVNPPEGMKTFDWIATWRPR